MSNLNDAVEEIKRALIGNKSKDVTEVYLGNAIRYIEEYQRDIGEGQFEQDTTRFDEALHELITFTLKQNAVPSDIIYDFYRPNNKVISYEEVAESYPPSITAHISTLVTYFSIACHRMDFTTEIVNYHNAIKNRFVKAEQPEKKQKVQKLKVKRVFSQYPSEFDEELGNVLNWISLENLIDIKYEMRSGHSVMFHSALVIYR